MEKGREEAAFPTGSLLLLDKEAQPCNLPACFWLSRGQKGLGVWASEANPRRKHELSPIRQVPPVQPQTCETVGHLVWTWSIQEGSPRQDATPQTKQSGPFPMASSESGYVPGVWRGRSILGLLPLGIYLCTSQCTLCKEGYRDQLSGPWGSWAKAWAEEILSGSCNSQSAAYSLSPVCEHPCPRAATPLWGRVCQQVGTNTNAGSPTNSPLLEATWKFHFRK